MALKNTEALYANINIYGKGKLVVSDPCLVKCGISSTHNSSINS